MRVNPFSYSEIRKPPDSVHKRDTIATKSCTNDVSAFSPVHASLNNVIKIPLRRDTLVMPMVTHALS